jgi:hypothetical protein
LLKDQGGAEQSQVALINLKNTENTIVVIFTEI